MNFTSNDTAPDLTGTLTSGGDAVNLTGATLALHIRRPDETVLDVVPVVVNATAGTWSYSWEAGDLSATGRHDVEVQVTYSDARIQTFGPRAFYVQPEIA